MTNQESINAIKALNIVFSYWIKPTQKIKLCALKKIQRFCRRGSGAHAHHNMICNKADFGDTFGPPVLYRQRQSCMHGECKSIPIRIYNKYQRMRYAIDKIFEHNEEDGYNFDCPTERNTDRRHNILDDIRNKKTLIKHYISMECCFCNNKPFSSYECMVAHPRGNYTAKDGLRYIMCELSGDELTYYTRFKLSNYLAHRLS